jgi:heptosyltransferase-2
LNSDKILFIQTAFPGDAILALPAIQKLKETNPDSSIDVLCIPETQEIFNASPSISDIIVIDKRGVHKTIVSTYKFIKKVKQNNYSKIYSSHRSLRTALIVFLLKVNESYGFDNSSLMHIYKYLVPYDISKHEVQRNLDLVGFNYDNEAWKFIPEINSDATIRENIKTFLSQNKLKNDFIAVAPGSVWNTKIYPIEYYKEIVKDLINKKYRIVLIGGKKDEEICSDLASGFEDNAIVAAGNFTIVESVELLRHSKLLISNDSAPTHMGMSANIKVLTIYCSTAPEFGFYPYNNKSIYISYSDLKCKPCGIHGHDVCPIKSFDCGMKLLPHQIISKVEEMLSDRT